MKTTLWFTAGLSTALIATGLALVVGARRIRKALPL